MKLPRWAGGRMKGFVARGLSPNGDGHDIDYQDPPSLPSVTTCLWIITTNVIYNILLIVYVFRLWLNIPWLD